MGAHDRASAIFVFRTSGDNFRVIVAEAGVLSSPWYLFLEASIVSQNYDAQSAIGAVAWLPVNSHRWSWAQSQVGPEVKPAQPFRLFEAGRSLAMSTQPTAAAQQHE